MRKKLYFLILLLPLFFVRVKPAQGAYHVTVGNTFQYDMLLAEVDITIGGTRYTGSGFSISGNHVDQGTMCTIQVNSVTATTVTSTLYGGTYSQSYISEWVLSDDISFNSLILSWLHKAQPYLTNPTLVSNGLGLIFFPFVEYALSFDFFEEYVAKTSYQLTGATSAVTNPTFKCVSEEKDGLYYFESYFSGSDAISGGSPEYDLDFSVRLKFAYDRSYAVLQGMHFLAEGRGIFNGQKAKYRCESLIELQFYDLPNFKLSFFDITYDWWIIPTAVGGGLILIGTIVFVSIRAKRGKKKPKKKSKKKSTKKKKK
jgi:hypothetical protein